MKLKPIWFVVAAAFLLRIVSVANFPAGLNADEASFGYDAYSIANTGKDQWGNFLPIVLKSFGDYKSPVYSYLAIPTVKVFGLNTFATRLPNVIVGTLAVLAVYFLVLEVLKLKIFNSLETGKWKLEIIASTLLAFNPWSVMLSRGAAEANLITFFLPFGIFLFLKGIRNHKFLIFSALSFGVSMFTYHSAKVITPLVVAGLVIIFIKDLRKNGFKKIVVPLLVFSFFLIAMFYTFSIGGGSRISERSITQGAILQGFDERMYALSKGQNPVVAKIFHNKYQVILARFVSNYLQYFSPKFLVQKGVGDASYTMIPGIGVISILEFILIFGLVPLLINDRNIRKFIFALFLWLLITPLPAALASGGGYSGNRASGMLPILQIIVAFGFYGWVDVVNRINKNYVKSLIVISSIVFIFGIFNFIKFYFKNQSTTIFKQQGYGNLQVAEWLKNNANGRNVILSRSISEPQIFVAFANKWDPTNFQNSTKSWNFDNLNIAWVDQIPEYSVDNYKFKSIDWVKDVDNSSLIVVRADEFSGSQIPTKIFYYPDGTDNIYVIDTNQKIYAKNI